MIMSMGFPFKVTYKCVTILAIYHHLPNVSLWEYFDDANFTVCLADWGLGCFCNWFKINL